MPTGNIAKTKRPEAERAGEHWAKEMAGCVVTRRALRTKFAKVDFFAADIIGKRADGAHYYIQVTAGGDNALRTRRRKLEKVPWHKTDSVRLLQLVSTPDPANSRRKLFFFRVHRYTHKTGGGTWEVDKTATPVPKEWFKALKG